MRLALAALLLWGCGGGGATAGDGSSSGADGGGGGAETGAKPEGGSAPDVASMMMGAKSVDECFTGLRALVGAFQDATRTSADGKYTLRLALETADRGGTSGSYAWAAVRVALETPEGSLCISDETTLAGAYKGSHHNCMDTLTVGYGNTRYVIRNPDSAADYADKTKWRREGRLEITREDVVLAPIPLQTIKCNKSNRSDGACASGGPC